MGAMTGKELFWQELLIWDDFCLRNWSGILKIRIWVVTHNHSLLKSPEAFHRHGFIWHLGYWQGPIVKSMSTDALETVTIYLFKHVMSWRSALVPVQSSIVWHALTSLMKYSLIFVFVLLSNMMFFVSFFLCVLCVSSSQLRKHGQVRGTSAADEWDQHITHTANRKYERKKRHLQRASPFLSPLPQLGNGLSQTS